MRVPPSWRRTWPVVAAIVTVSALGWRNPVDTFLRSRFVRALDTGTGAHTATLCMSAETAQEVRAQRAELPDRVAALHAAGAAVVAIDLDLTAPHPTDEALRAAAAGGPTVFGRPAHAQPFSFERPSGVTDMTHTWFIPLNLGAPLPVQGEVPLAYEALALYENAPQPVVGGDGWHIGGLTVPADVAAMSFMPYLIPFVDWDDRSTWGPVEGRVVFVGACKPDRELTRYGRQPGPVAHGELLETALSGFAPRQAGGGLDIALALATLGAGLGARRRLGRAGALAVGVAVVAAALGVALTGTWLGLSGLVLAAAAAASWPLDERTSDADAHVQNALAAGRLARMVARPEGESDECTLPPPGREERDAVPMFVASERGDP
jgi:hypothetical protein